MNRYWVFWLLVPIVLAMHVGQVSAQEATSAQAAMATVLERLDQMERQIQANRMLLNQALPAAKIEPVSRPRTR